MIQHHLPHEPEYIEHLFAQLWAPARVAIASARLKNDRVRAAGAHGVAARLAEIICQVRKGECDCLVIVLRSAVQG